MVVVSVTCSCDLVVEISGYVEEMKVSHRKTERDFARLDSILEGFDDQLDKINMAIREAKAQAMRVSADLMIDSGEQQLAVIAGWLFSRLLCCHIIKLTMNYEQLNVFN